MACAGRHHDGPDRVELMISVKPKEVITNTSCLRWLSWALAGIAILIRQQLYYQLALNI